MRDWKIAARRWRRRRGRRAWPSSICSIAAASSAGAAGAAAPRSRHAGHAGAGGDGRQEDGPDLSRLFGAHGSDPQRHACRRKVAGYLAAAARARRRRREGGRPPLPDRSARLSGGARPGQGAGAARRAALDYARANLDRGDELAKSGCVAKDTFDQRDQHVAPGAKRRSRWTRRRSARRELNLGYTEIRAPFAGPPRPQPGADRHAGQRRRHARSTRWCSSTRST